MEGYRGERLAQGTWTCTVGGSLREEATKTEPRYQTNVIIWGKTMVSLWQCDVMCNGDTPKIRLLSPKQQDHYNNLYLVGGLEHEFCLSMNIGNNERN